MMPAVMSRSVMPELLDTMDADDPRAIHSRQDLRRINGLMGNMRHLRSALDRIVAAGTALHLVEFGAGDGSLMLRLARSRCERWPDTRITLVDRVPCVSSATRAAVRATGWTLEELACDVFDWLGRPAAANGAVIVANLFMHHLSSAELARLLPAIANSARAFVCCEPRRTHTALLGSHLLGMIGCNAITRHDATVSVRAGFRDQELTALWPRADGSVAPWRLSESATGPFTHRFVAWRTA